MSEAVVAPRYPLRDLTPDELDMFERYGRPYVKFEAYPEQERRVGVPVSTGKYWTQAELDAAGVLCEVPS